jgi:hypothetical protein
MDEQPPKQPQANYDYEASQMCKALKAKGIVMIVFGGAKGTGLSVQIQDKEEMLRVPGLLRQMAFRMEQDLRIGTQGKG